MDLNYKNNNKKAYRPFTLIFYVNDFYKTFGKLHIDVLNCAAIYSIVIIKRVDC